VVEAHVESTSGISTGGVTTLLRWYRPYLKGYGWLFSWAVVALLIVLATQALIPLTIEKVLHVGNGEWSTSLISALGLLVLLQLGMGYAARLAALELSTGSAQSLRLEIFDKMLHTDLLHQRGLRRPSIVSRHSSDVDKVSDACKNTVIDGVPAVARVLLSLTLLTLIEWRAGLAMAIVSIIFVLFRTYIGRNLLADDHERLMANGDMDSAIDETLGSSQIVVGLHLEEWMRRRFFRHSAVVEETSKNQERTVARLVLGAETTALMGLYFVVVVAVAAGGRSLASVAAAILYVEGVVAGLKVLPAWMRSVQLGVAGAMRIDDILLQENRITPPVASATIADESGLVLDHLTTHFKSGTDVDDVSMVLPLGRMIGVVTPVGAVPDQFLSLLAGDENPYSGHVRFRGVDVRVQGTAQTVSYVPAVAVGFEDSPLAQLQAVDPTIGPDEARLIFGRVGLAHLGATQEDLDRNLWHSADRLTINDRQRLALALALASKPDVLMVGPILALSEVETAVPLITMLRAAPLESVVIAVASAEVAESVDDILFLADGKVHLSSHNQMLDELPTYAHLWAQRLAFGEVDLSVLGIDDDLQDTLSAKLVTERFSQGEVIYRQGDDADRIVFVISGRIEISLTDEHDQTRRVAVLGPGNHCGDLRLTASERRVENASAIEDSVLRTLSRDVISAGVLGMLDRSIDERRVMTVMLRDGVQTHEELAAKMTGVDPEAIATALSLLLRDGALNNENGAYSIVRQRSSNRGAGTILDRLADL